jgi:hypothetical protein
VDRQQSLEHHLRKAVIEEKYSNDLVSRGVLGEFAAVEWQPTEPLGETVLNYLKEGGPDFVALAPRTTGLQERNSMTE